MSAVIDNVLVGGSLVLASVLIATKLVVCITQTRMHNHCCIWIMFCQSRCSYLEDSFLGYEITRQVRTVLVVLIQTPDTPVLITILQ